MHVEQSRQTEKRDKLDIMIQLLQISREPIRKTRLMQVAYLNFYQVSKYLDYLMSASLLEAITKPYPGYKITEKGRMFLALLTATDNSQGKDGEMADKLGQNGDGIYIRLSQIEQALRDVFKEDAVALLMERIRSVRNS